MLIKMTKEVKGCEDGINEKTYQKGETYDVATSFCNICVEEGWGKKVKLKDEKAKKGISGASENKSLKGAEENK